MSPRPLTKRVGCVAGLDNRADSGVPLPRVRMSAEPACRTAHEYEPVELHDVRTIGRQAGRTTPQVAVRIEHRSRRGRRRGDALPPARAMLVPDCLLVDRQATAGRRRADFVRVREPGVVAVEPAVACSSRSRTSCSQNRRSQVTSNRIVRAASAFGMVNGGRRTADVAGTARPSPGLPIDVDLVAVAPARRCLQSSGSGCCGRRCTPSTRRR